MVSYFIAMGKLIGTIILVIVVAGLIVWVITRVFPIQLANQPAPRVGFDISSLLKLNTPTTTPSLPVVESIAGATSTLNTIEITDGVKHSIPLNELVSGGVAQDGIPSIDAPKFVSTTGAQSFLENADVGIVVDMRGVQRFYPYKILVWHEIVNDTIAGQGLLITFCPLCMSGIVFDPMVGGDRAEFGVSGKLWNSNLVMYDRGTNSLWSQVLGEAIVGEMTGATLPVLPFDILEFGTFKKTFPHGEVLSTDTGVERVYGLNPYGEYYTQKKLLFPVAREDKRLATKEVILGIVIDGKAKAYYPPAVKKKGNITDTFASTTIVAQYDKELKAVRLFEEIDGTLERLNPITTFWFTWAAVHPETELYK